MRFSQDESKLAVGLGPRWNFDPRPRRVVVVAVDQPQKVLREFQIGALAAPNASGRSLEWSPSGAILMVKGRQPAMLRFGTDAPCSFPDESEFGGFLSEDRMVLFRRGGLKTQIEALRPDCSVADSWQADGPAEVLDTSPEKDLLAIRTYGMPSQSSAVDLVASKRHEIKRSWALDDMATYRGGFLFSDRGETVCSAFYPEGRRVPDAACWGTRTGAKTVEDNMVAVDKGAIESTGGELVAITDYKYIFHEGKIWQFLDMDSDYTVPRRQLLWNVRTGKEVDSWGEWGGFQQMELSGRDPKKNLRRISIRFVLCLSPTGKYFAEGGSGLLSVYSVLP